MIRQTLIRSGNQPALANLQKSLSDHEYRAQYFASLLNNPTNLVSVLYHQ